MLVASRSRQQLERHPRRVIFISALVIRLAVLGLLRLCQLLQGAPFDSSHLIVDPTVFVQQPTSTLRWDALHFLAIAQRGYEYEQQLAFQPGWPLLLRYASMAWRSVRHGVTPIRHGPGCSSNVALSVQEIVRTGEILACLSYAGAAMMLYTWVASLAAMADSEQRSYSSWQETADSAALRIASSERAKPGSQPSSTSCPLRQPSCRPLIRNPCSPCLSFQATTSASVIASSRPAYFWRARRAYGRRALSTSACWRGMVSLVPPALSTCFANRW